MNGTKNAWRSFDVRREAILKQIRILASRFFLAFPNRIFLSDDK